MSSKDIKRDLTPRIRRLRGRVPANRSHGWAKKEEHSKYQSFTVPCRADTQGDRDKNKNKKKKENQTSGQHQLDLP